MADGLDLLQAVRLTLAHSPQIHIARKDRDLAEATLQEASGAFDPSVRVTGSQQQSTVAEWPTEGGGYSSSPTAARSLGLELAVPLRVGPTITTAVRTDQTDSESVDALNEGSLSITVLIPLMRELGFGLDAGREAAARAEWQAARAAYTQQVAEHILVVLDAYWALVSAAQGQRILAVSEERTGELNNMLAALVQAGELARADLQIMEAYSTARTAERIRAQSAFANAREALGLAMGLDPHEVMTLAEPSSPFPAPSDSGVAVSAAYRKNLTEQALERRGDWRALHHGCAAAEALARSARNQLRPQCDLTLRAAYLGRTVSDGWDPLSAFGEPEDELGAAVAVAFEWPVPNRAARGRFAGAVLLRDRKKIELDDLRRRISSSIAQDLTNLRSWEEQVLAFQAAEALYEKAFQNEKEKLRIGMAGPIDLLTTEEQLTWSSLQRLGAQEQYARTIARLRLDSGTLVSCAHEEITVDEQCLSTVPRPEQLRTNASKETKQQRGSLP